MRKQTIVAAASLLGAVALSAATSVHASVAWTVTFDADVYCTSSDPDCVGRANSMTFTPSSGDPSFDSVTVTAWANTVNDGGSIDVDLERGLVGEYGGGLGVTWTDTDAGDSETLSDPQHTLDNSGNLELLLFDFGTPITLSEVTLGYISNDSDISVLAHTGAGDGDLTGLTYTTSSEDLTSNGWELIGNYDVDFTDPSNPYTQPLTTTAVSSLWLVAAYNPVFPGCETSFCNIDKKDYVKVLGLGGDSPDDEEEPPPGVPEPATLLLLAAGLPFLRRRGWRQQTGGHLLAA